MHTIRATENACLNIQPSASAGKLFKVLIADSDSALCKDLAASLCCQGYELLIAEDADSCLKLVTSTPPDLILLSTVLPSASGLAVCGLLREQIRVPILFLAAAESALDRLFAYKLGADAWIVKPFSSQEISSRIALFLGRKSLATETAGIARKVSRSQPIEQICVGNLILLPSQYVIMVNQKRIDLSLNEFRLLHLLAKHAGEVVEHEAIRHYIWGEETKAYANLPVLIRHVREKIEANPSRPRYLISAYNRGYLLRGS